MSIHPRIAAARERSRTRLERAEAGGTGAGRLGETVLLLLSTLVVAAGLFLTYSAKAAGEGTSESHTFDETARLIEAKQVVNLNAPARAADLAPLLVIDRNASEADRRFAAGEIENFLKTRGAVANVGALAQLRVNEDKIDDPKLDLDFYRSRLDAERKKRDAAQQPPAEGAAPTATPAAAPAATPLSLRVVPSVGTDKPSLVVRTPAEFRSSLLLYFLVYLAGFYLVHLVWTFRRFRGDRVLLPCLHLLSGLGLIMTVSLFDPLRDKLYFPVFAQGALVGCVMLLVVSFTDFQATGFRRLALVPLALSFLLSVLLIIWGTAPEGSGARVNLSVGPVSFQPVELITRLIVLFMAGYFARHWEFLRELREERGGILGRLNLPRLAYFVPPVVGMGLAFVFFRAQQDLGPALVMFFTFVALYAVARRRVGMVLLSVALLVGAFALSYQLNSPRTIQPRVQMWLSPWDAPGTFRDQIARSLWALSTGATTGTGLGLGDAGEGALPAFHTDLVLAALGEELGFAGVLSVFVLLGLLLWRGFRIALEAPGDYSFFLALGLTVSVAVQCVLIMGGTLGVLPLSGVVLPFLSFGRSALIANFSAFGVLAAISARARGPAQETEQTFGRPVRLVAAAAAALALVILGKAAYVQVVRADDFVARAHYYTTGRDAEGRPERRALVNSRLLEAAELIPRGSIYDRSGVPLETNRREELERWRAVYSELGVALDQLQPDSRGRYRPFGGPASNLFINLDEYDPYRRGYEKLSDLVPLLRYRFRPEADEYRRVTERGRDLRLSIDVRLQLDVARLLAAKLGPERRSGAAVVTDARTGELLASVSYPWPGAEMIDLITRERRRSSGDVPRYAEERLKTDDRASQSGYAPGSTFKIVTAIAALRKDPALDARTYECRPLEGTFVGNRVRGRNIRDFEGDRAHGPRTTLEQAVYKSCNAYFAQLGTDAVGAADLAETARLLRVEHLAVARGGKTVVERLDETLADASFGQGEITVSPRTMARVAATIANGGEVPPDLFLIGGPEAPAAQRVTLLAPTLAARLALYMHEVVANPEGTAYRYVTPPFRDVIAGKTGTAQTGHRLGNKDVTHAWFMGFAPYAAPDRRRVALSIVLEYREDGVGGRDAAPLAEKIVAAARARGHIQ